MLSDHTRKQILTVPNLLSFFRLLLIPLYIYIYLNAASEREYAIAGFILTVSCLTDIADGRIARKYHMVSQVGIVLDPIADKSTQLAITICLLRNHPGLYPLLILFLIKESFQVIAGVVAYLQGRMLPGALPIGKICTTVLFISFISLVVFQHMSDKLVNLIIAVDIFFLCLSFIGYILAYFGKNRKTRNLSDK